MKEAAAYINHHVATAIHILGPVYSKTGWWFQPLRNRLVSWDDEILNIWVFHGVSINGGNPSHHPFADTYFP